MTLTFEGRFSLCCHCHFHVQYLGNDIRNIHASTETEIANKKSHDSFIPVCKLQPFLANASRFSAKPSPADWLG